MLIDYESIELQALPNFKGGQKEFNVRMFADGKHKIMKGFLEPGASIGLHAHEGSDEIMFFTGGVGQVIYDGDQITVKEGDVHYCQNGHSHTLINNGPGNLEFFAVVSM